MLGNSAAIAVGEYELLADFEDVDEDRSAACDYAWMLSLDLVRETEHAWRSFRNGYAAGGKIGRRRYARSRAFYH